VSQSGSIGQADGRVLVALFNLDAENPHVVRIEAKQAAGTR
jgi:hypothetical protein